MKDCHIVREHLSAYMDGNVDGVSKRQVEGHLSECNDCAQQLRLMQKLSHRLSSMERVKAPEDFLGSLRQRIEQPQRQGLTPNVPLGMVALAAVVVIALSILHREPQMRHILQDVRQPALEEIAPPKAKDTSNDVSVKAKAQPPAPASFPDSSKMVKVPEAPAKKQALIQKRAELPTSQLADKPVSAPLQATSETSETAPAAPAQLKAPVAAPPMEASAEPAAKSSVPDTVPAAPKGFAAPAGKLNSTDEMKSTQETIRHQERIVLTVSIPPSFAPSKVLGDKDSLVTKEENISVPRALQNAPQPAHPDVFDRIAALVSENGGKIVSDKIASKQQYIDAEISVEAYAALLKELLQIANVQELYDTDKEDIGLQKDRQKQTNIVQLHIIIK
ncbi:MAG: zf-HC2 domain-containing protein [Nitrospirae bacterium]|nr:zf-HC2 domain-containing protein [Nitrospirota bacterium]